MRQERSFIIIPERTSRRQGLVEHSLSTEIHYRLTNRGLSVGDEFIRYLTPGFLDAFFAYRLDMRGQRHIDEGIEELSDGPVAVSLVTNEDAVGSILQIFKEIIGDLEDPASGTVRAMYRTKSNFFVVAYFEWNFQTYVDRLLKELVIDLGPEDLAQLTPGWKKLILDL